MSSLDSLSSSPGENVSSLDYYDTQYQSDESDIVFSLNGLYKKEKKTQSSTPLENTRETIAVKAEAKKMEDAVRTLEKDIIDLNKKLSDVTMQNAKLKNVVEFFRCKSKEYYFLAKANSVEAEFLCQYGYSLGKTIYWNE